MVLELGESKREREREIVVEMVGRWEERGRNRQNAFASVERISCRE
jgi:hypothetical protein